MILYRALMSITEATSDTDENVCLWLLLLAHSGHFSRLFFFFFLIVYMTLYL